MEGGSFRVHKDLDSTFEKKNDGEGNLWIDHLYKLSYWKPNHNNVKSFFLNVAIPSIIKIINMIHLSSIQIHEYVHSLGFFVSH